MEKDAPRQFGLVESSQADEPSWLFPRAIRPQVFRVMWLALGVLLVVLLLVVLEYGRLT